jgi:hypothetical protein
VLSRSEQIYNVKHGSSSSGRAVRPRRFAVTLRCPCSAAVQPLLPCSGVRCMHPASLRSGQCVHALAFGRFDEITDLVEKTSALTHALARHGELEA